VEDVMMGREEGQATPLMAALVVLAGLVALAVAGAGGGAVDAARARTAADAAALAGAAEGRPAAAMVAGDNGGRLVVFQSLGTDVIVVVEVGGARARSRARASWP